MSKYLVTFENGDVETVNAWKMEFDSGVLTFFDETGEMDALFMAVKSVRKLQESV